MGTPGQANITTKEAPFVYEIETEKDGATRFTSTDQAGGQEFERQFSKSLFNLTGCHNHVWGHYGTLNDTGGLNVHGQFCVKEIREGT
ncbi:MAG: hypothetical protein H0X47_09150 [Nitrospirales bacterium]|nr:hypothetical protein [Nitrospirales bacterium]